MDNNLKFNFISFNKDAYITIEGKPSKNCFYIIKSGNATLVRDAVKEIETLTAGDFFGVISAMSNHDYIETTQATTEVSLIIVQKDQFPFLIQKNPSIATKIILSFSKRLRQLDVSITELTLKSSSEVSGDAVLLYNLGKFYQSIKQNNQAFYAFNKFIKYCPEDQNLQDAKDQIEQLKPISKAVYLEKSSDDFKKSYPDNTMIFCEHEPGNELYIIQSGQVKITKMIDNKDVLLAVLKEGDIFGEMSLIEEKPRSASATAYGETNLMAINKENFNKMIATQPQLVTRLISLLSERTWVVYRQLSNLKIENKVGRTLDILLLNLEKNKIQIQAKVSHQFEFGTNELVNMVGLQKNDGDLVVKEILENKKFKLIENKIFVNDIEEIKKQVDYYKKMQVIEQQRKNSRQNR